jgi:2-hydroxychromene-2-carboxylate isomerase
MTKPSLDFWFEFGSTYSYLSAMRVVPLAQAEGVALRWRPFLLGPIFQAQGWQGSPFNIYPAKGAHMWKDMQRQTAKFSLPWRQPSAFPRRAILATRIALLGAEQDWGPSFVQGCFQLNFVHDHDLEDVAVLGKLLAKSGAKADTVIAAASSEANKSALRKQTAQAQEFGIFGAPSFVVNGELYWGNDRLEDALAAAQSYTGMQRE